MIRSMLQTPGKENRRLLLGFTLSLAGLVFLVTNVVRGTPYVQDNEHQQILTQKIVENFQVPIAERRVDLEFENASLKEVLREFTRQAGIRFSVQSELADEKRITYYGKNLKALEVLAEILYGSDLLVEVSDNKQVIIIREKETPEEDLFQETVTGRVVDSESGEPIPGVNIIIQGTSDGTVTSMDGEFELVVPDLQQVLVVSYIGYNRQEVPLDGRIEMEIELVESVAEMDELVVTAFGMERQRKALGYATQEIDNPALTTAKEVNVANSMQGRVAGVQVNRSSGGPGGSSSITIRGSSSLTGNNQPLYVIDGVPIDNSNLDPASYSSGRDYGDGIGNLNPDDIESMNVLKGPSAAALYGARGANGVIVITTKQGSTDSDRMQVSVNSSATFEFLNVMPTFQNKWGSGYGGGYGMFGTREVDGVEYPMFTNSMYDHWGGEMDGRMITYLAMPEIGVVPYSPQPKDNVREVFRTGQTLHNSIAFSGGAGSTSYRLSLSDMRNQHIIPNSDMERQSISLNFASAIRENLRVEGRVNYISQQGNNRPDLGFSRSGGNVMASLNELPRAVDLDWLKNYKRPDGTQFNHRQGFPNNPYWIFNEMLSEDDRRRIIGHLTLNYDMTDWLNVQVRGGTDFYNDARFERNAPNTYGDMDGSVTNNDWSVREDNLEAMLTAESSLTQSITGLFSIGANHLSQNREVRGFRGEQIIAAGVYDISNTQRVIPRNSIRNKEINSIFGMAQLGYNDFLFLDLTGRNDWSSTLSSDNRSFFYPSATLSFSFTDVMDINPDLLTFGKLRFSVASAGNDADPYLTNVGYSIDDSRFRGARFASANNTIPVTDLKNELTVSYEAGADLRFFQNRLGIDFTYYQASTRDQILPIEISRTSGYTRRFINAGEIANQGFELMFNVVPVQSTSFMWDVNFNFSRNKSEVVELADGLESLNLIQQGNANIEARPGQPYGNIVGYEYKKNENGDRVLNENGGLIRSDEQVVLGNIQPDLLGGIDNTFVYKNISLSALVDFRLGGQVFSHTKYRQYTQGVARMTLHREEEMFFDGVIENPDGTYRENDMPVTAQTYYATRGWSNVGEEFVIDSDYAALRELTLGYEFGETLLEKTPLSSARLSIVARNVFYIYRDEQFKTMGIAPEGTYNTSTAAQGFETANMPTTRSIGFNVSFNL